MTQDEIIEMAREADCSHVDLNGDKAKAIERLEAFAKLVAAKEREACAKVCEEIAQESDAFTESILRATVTEIRARGEQA